MLKARLARFYGWTDSVIENMSYSKVQDYVLCIETLTAYESLSLLGVSAYPHMKPANAKKYEKDLKSRAKKNIGSSQKQMSTEEIYTHLVRTLGNG